ncbi:7238_t:CDS:1, partial [Racocetra fulgida]
TTIKPQAKYLAAEYYLHREKDEKKLLSMQKKLANKNIVY